MDAVMRLCQKVILLKYGNLQGIGNSNSIIQSYLREDYGTTALCRWREAEAPRSKIVRLVEVRVHNEEGAVGEVFNISKPVGLTVEYEVLASGSVLTPAFNLFNDRGINIFDSHDTSSEWRAKSKLPGHYFSTVWIPGNLLSEGIVVVGVAIVTPDPFYIHLHEKDAVAFNVVDNFDNNSARGDYVGPFPGVVRPLLKWYTVASNYMDPANHQFDGLSPKKSSEPS
jgi:lipopolysaccharide transport system ATP-binding protein